MWSIASSYGSVFQRHYVVYILQDPSNHQEVRTILAWRLSPPREAAQAFVLHAWGHPLSHAGMKEASQGPPEVRGLERKALATLQHT